MTPPFHPADVRERFLQPLLNHIEENDLAGDEIYLKRLDVDEIIDVSQAHTGFFKFFSDEEIAELIADKRIDWQTTFVTTEQTSDSVTLLSHLIYHMEMENYFTWLPNIVKALNDRYTPQEQLSILKKCEAMPGRTSSVLDGRTVLAGRIVPIILQDEFHLNAWVDEWLRGIKTRENSKSNFCTPFSEQFKVSRAYKKLEPADGSVCRIPMLMVLAGVMDHEMVTTSIRRYTTATLYDLSYGGFSGHFTHTGDDFTRRNFQYGLSLLDDISRQRLIRTYLGKQVIEDNHVELAACILASSVNWDSSPVPVSKLLELRDESKYTPLRRMLNDHLFKWGDDWFDKLAANPFCRELMTEVCTLESIDQWCSDYAVSTSKYSSLSTTRQLKDWVKLLSVDDREAFLGILLERFEFGIKHSTSSGRRGMVYAKLLIGAFPENEHAKKKVADLIYHLIKHAISDQDPEIIAEVVKLEAISLKAIGSRIKSLEQLGELTARGGLDKELVLPHVPLMVRGDSFVADLGL